MKTIIAIAFVLGCFISPNQAFSQNESPEFKAEVKKLSSESSCGGKKNCIIVYAAPWCPACQQMSPLFIAWQRISKINKEFGVNIIIGMEKSPGENKAYAEKLDPGVSFDADNSIGPKLETQGFPKLVLTENGNILTMGRPAVTAWFREKFPPPKRPETQPPTP